MDTENIKQITDNFTLEEKEKKHLLIQRPIKTSSETSARIQVNITKGCQVECEAWDSNL